MKIEKIEKTEKTEKTENEIEEAIKALDIPGEAGESEINILELGNSTNIIVFTEIVQGECIENPQEEFDGEGKIYSFNKRHTNYIHPDNVEDLCDGKLRRCVLLDYYEHSGCSWSVSGDQTNPLDGDFCDAAGVWIPDEICIETVETQNRRKLGLGEVAVVDAYRNMAREACDRYTKYFNGEVYGYCIEAYEAKTDEDEYYIEEREHYQRHHTQLFYDVCSGFYDREYMERTIREAIEYGVMEHIKRGENNGTD